jgi:hypothetical protein
MLARSIHRKAGLALLAVMATPIFCLAQDRDRDRDQDWDTHRGVYTRLSPGTTIPIRLKQTIDVDRTDNRVYYGTVDQDVMGNNGRVAIPRGANAELIVRVARDNDLILDLESVMVSGQRYAVRSDPNRYESRRDDSVVGAIVGAISGMQVQGRAVRVPRDSVVTFRLDRPLEIGVQDRGVDRDGGHYHDCCGGRGGQK